MRHSPGHQWHGHTSEKNSICYTTEEIIFFHVSHQSHFLFQCKIRLPTCILEQSSLGTWWGNTVEPLCKDLVNKYKYFIKHTIINASRLFNSFNWSQSCIQTISDKIPAIWSLSLNCQGWPLQKGSSAPGIIQLKICGKIPSCQNWIFIAYLPYLFWHPV